MEDIEQKLDEGIFSLTKELATIMKKTRELEQVLSELNVDEVALRTALVNNLERLGLVSVAVKGVGRLTRVNTRHYSFVSGKEEELIDWIDVNGYSVVAPRAISKSRLREMVDDLLAHKKALPPESVLSTYVKDTVRLTLPTGENK